MVHANLGTYLIVLGLDVNRLLTLVFGYRLIFGKFGWYPNNISKFMQ